MKTQRLWTISDIHIDYPENRQALLELSDTDYRSDMLIIAGDATNDVDLLGRFLAEMRSKFAQLAFVPGNHELWLSRTGGYRDSVHKFHVIMDLCRTLDVRSTPRRFGDSQAVWVVPLQSWYHTTEHREHTLYMVKGNHRDRTREMWGDFTLTRWPDDVAGDIAGYFTSMNQAHVARRYDAPVVTFSHFLPRQDLMMSTEAERADSDLVHRDLVPEFNFSHVAGTKILETQIRATPSRLHIYGHQHRNRLRSLDGITYLSHCMGYPKERRVGVVAAHAVKPLQVWNTREGFLV